MKWRRLSGRALFKILQASPGGTTLCGRGGRLSGAAPAGPGAGEGGA